ncbi:uncharacterized protein LOC134727748 [Mytilus trossulus]|uniref:uncharacterized protein LOC134727748 n=1 Tax=Mytilus trossulus TaxID=6551 RepID=UPI0030064736
MPLALSICEGIKLERSSSQGEDNSSEAFSNVENGVLKNCNNHPLALKFEPYTSGLLFRIDCPFARSSIAGDISTTQPNASNDDGRFSGGEITGIIVGVTALLAVVFSVFLFWRRRKKKKRNIQIPVPIEEVPLLSEAYFLKDPSDIECKEGEEAIFTFQICSNSPSLIVLKDGKDITRNDNYKMSSEGTHHVMKLMNTKYTDAGEYSVHVGQSYRKVRLNIKAYFLKDPSDIECKEGEEAIFTFQICLNSPSVILLKDGMDITGNDNYKMSSEGTNHELKLRNTKYTDAGEYSVQVGQSYRKVLLNIKELPTIEEKNTYLNALQFGEEERRYVRIQVIGKDRVGKTSLVRRLLGKGIDDVRSTDGIDIDKTCQIRTSDGEWIVGEVEEEKVQIEKRIQQAVNMKREVKELVSNRDHPSKDHPNDIKDKTNMIIPSNVQLLLADKEKNRIISADENNDNELATEYTKHTSDVSNNKVNVTDTVYVSADKTNFENREERDMKKVEQMPDTLEKQNSDNSNKSDQITAAISEHMDDILFYVKNKEHKMTSEGLVECGIWDFAGQKDYYATHQTFFTPDAIYLLVVDITDDIEAVQYSKQFNIDSSGEYIDFWLDSIHCFRTDRVDPVDVQNITAHLCPPVIVVCTGIDKVTDIEAKKKEYESKFLETFGNQKKSSHKRGIIHFISNKEFHKEGYENLKKDISEIAKEMKYFANKLPTKWILLENAIAVLKDIWKWKSVDGNIYRNIIEEFCNEIEELKGEFHKLDYKIKAKCNNGDPSISAGRIGYEDLTSLCKDGEYVCEEHQQIHSKENIENTWLRHAPIIQENIKRKQSLKKKEKNKLAKTVDGKETDYMIEILKGPIPWSIRVQIEAELEAWKEEDKLFIETNGAKSVLKNIEENGCVVVTGNSGTGKSALVRHVALQMQKKGYDIIPISNPEEIIKWKNPYKNTLFVVDDFCGTYTINQIEFEKWKNLMLNIKVLVESNLVKLIMVCRIQVYEHEQLKSLSFYQSCECNLMTKDISLSKSEKQSIAELYLQTKASKIIDCCDMFDCFPLLCQLCSKNKKLNIVNFFTNPFTVYKEEIDRLHIEGAHVKYCALALCVMFNNRLKEEWLTEDVDKDIKTIIKNTYEACKVMKGMSRLVVRDELDSLTDTFIRKEGTVYRTIHDKLFDFLAFYFGSVMINCLINNATSHFISERLLFERKEKTDAFTIIVTERYTQMYINRMVDDWSRKNVVDVFCNINMNNQIFRQRFLMHIKGLKVSQQTKLANLHDTNNNSTPLIQCCSTGDIALVTWCLHICISNINHCRNSNNESPLYIACEEGYTEVVQMLIHNKADINKCRNTGESPLYIACQKGHNEVVQMLINNKADINECRNTGESPLYIACQKGHNEVVQMLINNKADINKCDVDEKSPLFIACQEGHTEVVQMLINNKAYINKCDDDEISPLSIACQKGYTEVVQMLINNKADINKCDDDEISPLYIACQKGHSEVVQMLINNKADINKCDDDEISPLYIACQKGHSEVVQMLINNKADINKCDDDEISPLYIACQEGHSEVVQMLINNKADINKCSDIGDSPLDIALQNGHHAITDILKQTLGQATS